MPAQVTTDRYLAIQYDGTNAAEISTLINAPHTLLPGNVMRLALRQRRRGSQRLANHEQRIQPGQWVVWSEFDHDYILGVFTQAEFDMQFQICDCEALSAMGPEITNIENEINIVKDDILVISNQITNIENQLATQPLIQYDIGVTDGNGEVTFTWSPAFPEPPIVNASVENPAQDQVYTPLIRSNSALSTTIYVQELDVVNVVGINVISAPVDAAGVPVHIQAMSDPSSP